MTNAAREAVQLALKSTTIANIDAAFAAVHAAFDQEHPAAVAVSDAFADMEHEWEKFDARRTLARKALRRCRDAMK